MGWARLSVDFIRNRSISRANVGKLFGKLGFSQAAISSLFARDMMNPLYSELYSIPFYEKSAKQSIVGLKWMLSILTTMPPRPLWRRRGSGDYIAYADAACNYSKKGGWPRLCTIPNLIEIAILFGRGFLFDLIMRPGR